MGTGAFLCSKPTKGSLGRWSEVHEAAHYTPSASTHTYLLSLPHHPLHASHTGLLAPTGKCPASILPPSLCPAIPPVWNVLLPSEIIVSQMACYQAFPDHPSPTPPRTFFALSWLIFFHSTYQSLIHIYLSSVVLPPLDYEPHEGSTLVFHCCIPGPQSSLWHG